MNTHQIGQNAARMVLLDLCKMFFAAEYPSMAAEELKALIAKLLVFLTGEGYFKNKDFDDLLAEAKLFTQ